MRYNFIIFDNPNKKYNLTHYRKFQTIRLIIRRIYKSFASLNKAS